MLLKIIKNKMPFVFGFIFLLIILFTFSNIALAYNPQQGSSDNTTWGGEANTIQSQSGLGNDSPIVIAAKIINVTLGFLGIIAIVIIMYAGFLWMMSGGNPDKIDKAKKTLVSGVIGLVIIMASFAIAAFVLDAIFRATTGGNGANTGGSFPIVGPGGTGTPCTPGVDCPTGGTSLMPCSDTPGVCAPNSSTCSTALGPLWSCSPTSCLCEVTNSGSCYNPADDVCNYPCRSGLSCSGATGCAATACAPGDTSCQCCCDPGNDQCGLIYPTLFCKGNNFPCDDPTLAIGDFSPNAVRGSCCGCTADGECGGVATTGCGDDSCCYARPEVVPGGGFPVDGATDICTNALISVEFDQAMKGSSLLSSFLLIGEYSGLCPQGTSIIDVSPLGTTLTPIAGMNFCSVDGGRKARSQSGRYFVEFSMSDLLTVSTRYHIVMVGDQDTSNEIDEGILSYVGISKAGSEYISFTTKIEDGSGGLCAIDTVKLTPGGYLFNIGSDSLREVDNDVSAATFDISKDNDKLFRATPISDSGQVITPVSGYAWDWVLESSITSVIELDISPANMSDSEALAQVVTGVTDGHSTVSALVDMSAYAGSNSSMVGDQSGDSSEVYVFICDNPWPPIDASGFWKPWQPSAANPFNYLIYYCRDKQGGGTVNDLPAFDSSGIIQAPQFPILEHAYFSYQVPPPPGVMISADTMSPNATYPDGGAVHLEWSGVPASYSGGAVSYKIYYGKKKGIYTESIENVGSVQSYDVPGPDRPLLENGRQYYFAVTAITGKKAESSYFLGLPATPKDEYPPQSAPAFLTGVDNVIVSQTSIELHWTEDPDAASYELSYGLEAGFYGAEIDVSKDTAIIIENLSPATQYFFGIRSVDEAGNKTPFYNVIDATTLN